LDFAALCGKDKGVAGQIGDSLKDTAILGNMAHFYGMVNEEEERISCAMEHKRQLFKDTARNFIRALTVQDPAVSEASFREYADNIRTIAGADAMALTAEADMLAAQQNLVVRNVELIPLVGDAMDIMSAKTGEDLTGRKISNFEKSLILVTLITPEALEQFVKRFPSALPAMARFLKGVAMPKGGFVDHLMDTGDVLLLKAKVAAIDLLDVIGETKFAKEAAKSGQSAIEMAAKAQAKALKTADDIKLNLSGLPGIGTSRADAVAKSNMPDVWVDAMSKTAKDRGEVIFIRPVNKHSKKWLESGEAIGKGMDVKGKTSDWGPMAGLIPADQSLSKIGNKRNYVEKVQEFRKKIIERYKKEGKAYSKEAVEKEARERAQKVVQRKIDTYTEKVTNSLKAGHIQAVPLEKNGMNVVKIMEPNGKITVVMEKADGSFVTNAGKSFTPPKGAKVSPVEVLANEKGTYLAADADMLGVGTPRQQGNIREGATFDYAGHGGISDAETGTMFEVNVKTRMDGTKGNVINHGPATRYHEKPDFPVTMFLPDKAGSVAVIDNMDDLKKAFREAKKNGMTGLDPHPEWGWGSNWDKGGD